MADRAWTIAIANLQISDAILATASPDYPLDSALVVADGSMTLVQQGVQFKPITLYIVVLTWCQKFLSVNEPSQRV